MTTQVQSPKSRVFTRRVAPAILLLLTIASTFTAGALIMGDGGDSFLRSLGRGSLFAIAVLLSMGAHAFGHYLVARRNGVDATFPSGGADMRRVHVCG